MIVCRCTPISFAHVLLQRFPSSRLWRSFSVLGLLLLPEPFLIVREKRIVVFGTIASSRIGQLDCTIFSARSLLHCFPHWNRSLQIGVARIMQMKVGCFGSDFWLLSSPLRKTKIASSFCVTKSEHPRKFKFRHRMKKCGWARVKQRQIDPVKPRRKGNAELSAKCDWEKVGIKSPRENLQKLQKEPCN